MDTMLVLSRRLDEEIELEVPGLPEKIKIAYLGQLERKSRNGRKFYEARIGVKAPLSVKILRSELNTNGSEISQENTK